jgi:ATP-binding cassette subfamily B protein
MREQLRTLRLIVATAFSVDARATLLVLGIATFAWLTQPLQAVAIRAFADALAAHDAAAALAATLALGFMIGLGSYFFHVRTVIRLTLQERTTHALDLGLQELVGDMAGIEHLERPEYLDRLTTLRAQSSAFGNLSPILEFLPLILNVLLSAVLLALVSPVLLIIPLTGLPAIWLNGRGERSLQRAEAAVAAERRMRRRMVELGTDPAAAGEARLFEAGVEVRERFDAATDTIQRAFDRATVIQFGLAIASWTIYAAAVGLGFAVVGLGVIGGTISVGNVLLLLYLVRLSSYQADVTLNNIASIRRSLTATAGYLWLAGERDRVRMPDGLAELPPAGTLRFEHVGFRYPGTDRAVLEDVTFEIEPGATLAIVGDNGAGKTTLVKLLSRFYEPTAGRITVGAMGIAEIDVAAWRGGLTACLQDFSRFEFLVRETVGVGALGAEDDGPAVTGAVDAAGASDVVAAMPAGLESQLGTGWTGGIDVSIGQWQKLALARSMMRTKPLLLLLDEPTSALDAATEARLFERYAAASAFARASRAITIVVSHRMSTVRLADRIAVIEHGRLGQLGSHADLMAVEGPYRELYSTQAAAYA